tara:strand:- start:45565 stop:45729 length:165 start_codon:yes stop_codon:yes gene_type:complete
MAQLYLFRGNTLNFMLLKIKVYKIINQQKEKKPPSINRERYFLRPFLGQNIKLN